MRICARSRRLHSAQIGKERFLLVEQAAAEVVSRVALLPCGIAGQVERHDLEDIVQDSRPGHGKNAARFRCRAPTPPSGSRAHRLRCAPAGMIGHPVGPDQKQNATKIGKVQGVNLGWDVAFSSQGNVLERTSTTNMVIVPVEEIPISDHLKGTINLKQAQSALVSIDS